MDELLPQKQRRKKLGVVIGSGGIRSLAALPLLAHLRSKHILIDMIVGCGGGASLGALYGLGYDLGDIPALMQKMFNRNLMTRIDYPSLIKMLGVHLKPLSEPPALFKNDKLLKVYKEIFEDAQLEKCSPPLTIHASNLLTGMPVVLNSGPIAELVYASNSFYPFFRPIKWQQSWLSGGMFTAALPVITAVKANMDVILVIGVTDETQIPATGYVEYISSFLNRSATNIQSRQITLSISLHAGETVLMNIGFEKAINIWDTEALPQILLAGEATLVKFIDEIDHLTQEMRVLPKSPLTS